MKAAVINSYGEDGISAVSVEDVKVPEISTDEDEDDGQDGQVLIEVRAAGVDTMDIRIVQGHGRTMRDIVNRYNPNTHRTGFPIILGREGSGIIVEGGTRKG